MDQGIRILFIVCCLAGTLQAQQPFFRTYDLPEAFGNAPVRHIYQTQGKFLWLGTDAGLVLFDGHSYDLMLRPDSAADNRVTSMYRDQKDIFWVGYQDGGIFQYNMFSRLEAWMPEEGWPKAAITGFAEDGAGNLWMATYGEGLYYWNGKRLYNFGQDDGLSAEEVYTISRDGLGRIWAATDNGISICWLEDGRKQVRRIGRQEGLPDEIVRIMQPDEQGNCWVGTYERGFGYLSVEDQAITFWVPDWKYGIITALELISDKELWVGTDKSGIYRYRIDQQVLTKLPAEHLQSSRINDLHRDAEGNIWILSNAGELLSANLLFEFMDTGIRQVQAILVDRHDRLWVGTESGLYFYRQATDASAGFVLQAAGNYLSLFQDPYNNIWAGTFGEGLYIFNPDSGEKHHLSEADGLTNGSILSMDGLGEKVWLATLGGVTEISFSGDPLAPDALQFHNYRHEDGLGTNFIYQVFVDSRRQVWFATDGEGLTRLSGKQFTHIVEVDSIPVKTVYSITEDHDGNIWFSTPREGIFRFDGSRSTRFERSEGLRETNIVGMVTDPKNQILLIHPSGIDLFDPREERLIYYDKEVGVGNIEPNLNAFYQDEGGNIWIGTQNGVIRYAGSLPIRQRMPETYLRGISVDLQAINFAVENEFPDHRNNLIFDYSGLWYSDPESVRYRYKLEGFNPDWIVSRDQRAVYSQLPPGSYTFKLSASDNDLFFPEPQVVYAFTINPPFWRTPWFAILLALFLISGVYGIVRMREKRLERLAIMRREKLVHQFELLKSQINPHFLFNNFNTLLTLIEEDPPAAAIYVERLSDFYRSILQYRESPVIRLEEELDLLRNYVSLLKERFADNLRINICDKLRSGYIIPLTLQLLVENAIKHNTVSRDHPLTISISEAEPGYVVVKNNRQRKWREEPSTGFGLESINKRYALLTDRKVLLKKDQTEFTVSIPLLEMADTM